MQHSKSKPIIEYNALLLKCKYNKKFLFRIYALLFVYWLLSGINEALFQLRVARNIKQQVFIIEQSLKIFMILLCLQLYFYFPRTKVKYCLIAALTMGSLIMAFGAKFKSDVALDIGEIIIEVLHYSLSLSMLMITIEYFPKVKFGFIWLIAIFSMTFGKLLGLLIYLSQLSDEGRSIYIVLPAAIIYLLTLIIVKESPRYWIDHNITKAQQLLREIAQNNKVAYQPIEGLLQRQYFWHRIGLTKHSFLTVSKYKSISYNTYILCVCALLLGIICRCPDFIQHLRENSDFQVEDTVQTAWVSCFQICALIPSYLGSRTIKRKSIIMGCSIVLVILTIPLAILQLTDFYFGNALVYIMVIFGLSSFFSMGYFYFIILSAIQFFPHTVRTLCCGLIFFFYSLGRFLFSMHVEFIEKGIYLQRDSNMMELVICCSLLLLIHSWLLKQTFQDQGKYDLAEIEEKQTEDY